MAKWRSDTRSMVKRRSGQSMNFPVRTLFTEDLGFWWCHEREGDMCRVANSKPCGQGSCNRNDWNMTWGANSAQGLERAARLAVCPISLSPDA